MLLGLGHSHLLGWADWGWEQQGRAERCLWSQVGGGHGRSVPVFPVKLENSAAVMRLWKAWQCPLSPSGSPLSWGRTGQGPGHPHPSPEHSLRLTCVEPRRPVVGRWWECRLQGPRAAGSPRKVPGGCWLQIVPTAMELVGSSYRHHRGEVGGPGLAEGPPLPLGNPGPLLSPARGPPSGLGRWGGAAPGGHAGAPGVWGCGAGWCPPPALALPARGVLHHGDRGPQRGQVLAHQLPAEAAPQERYFCSWGGQALVLVLGRPSRA